MTGSAARLAATAPADAKVRTGYALFDAARSEYGVAHFDARCRRAACTACRVTDIAAEIARFIYAVAYALAYRGSRAAQEAARGLRHVAAEEARVNKSLVGTFLGPSGRRRRERDDSADDRRPHDPWSCHTIHFSSPSVKLDASKHQGCLSDFHSAGIGHDDRVGVGARADFPRLACA